MRMKNTQTLYKIKIIFVELQIQIIIINEIIITNQSIRSTQSSVQEEEDDDEKQNLVSV